MKRSYGSSSPDKRLRTEKKRQTAEMGQKTGEKGTGGLAVDIHPLLNSSIALRHLKTTSNPLKSGARKQFDSTALNPYLNQASTAIKPRVARPLQFNAHGKFIAQANKVREMESRDHAIQVYNDKLAADGLQPDENLGEQHYVSEGTVPDVEWWDRPFLSSSEYSAPLAYVYDNDEAPVTEYIQHPIIIPAPWEKQLIELQPKVMLTKQEQKKKRRNERLEKHRDKQDRIKLGLDPPPPPKVKLLNLMSVLTNEAIQDPTALEMKVRQEVQERYDKHMQANEDRKLTSEEKHQKKHDQNEKQLQKGVFTAVYRVESLKGNPKNFFKMDTNAKQLELVGICLVNPRFNLIVVQGSEKNITFYEKLMTKRINWTEYVKAKNGDNEDEIDLSGNRCRVVWLGQVRELNFQKWSIMHSRNDGETSTVLRRFDIENYWRKAEAIDN